MTEEEKEKGETISQMILDNKIDLDNDTIYGYTVRELLILAQGCRNQNIEEEDLGRLVTYASWMYDAIVEEMKNNTKQCLERIGKW